MDLYDFISNDNPHPAQKSEGGGDFGMVRQEKISYVEERELLREKIAALEGQYEELKKKRDELISQLQTTESDRNGLIARITSLEHSVSTLQGERNDLESHLQALSSAKEEADNLLLEKSSEIERLRAEISALQMELSATLDRMVHVEDEKRTGSYEFQRISKEFSSYKEKTGWAIVGICIVALTAVGGFLLHSTKNVTKGTRPVVSTTSSPRNTEGGGSTPKLKTPGIVVPQTKRRAKDQVSAEWPGRPFALEIGKFRIAVIPLEPAAVRGLPAAQRRERPDAYNFYLVAIRARSGSLSKEFMKSPSIGLIGRDTAHAQESSQGSGQRDVQVSALRKRYMRRGNILLRYVVSVEKDYRPSGITIRHLNKKVLKIAIY